MILDDGTPTRLLGKRGSPLIERLKRERMLHLMILPTLVVVLICAYFPMYGVVIAFKRYDVFTGIMESPRAENHGFEHFIDFMTAPQFYSVMRNTIVIAFLKLTLTMLPPVILAILFNEVNGVCFKRVTQTISYLPHFISWAVVGSVVYNFLNPSNGPLNQLLLQFGWVERSVDFISEDVYFWPMIVLTHIWKDVGWSSIIYLAVIVSIDPNLYEAIDIDGGGRLAKIWYVTLPHILGTFMILFILACGKIMSGMGDTFDQCYVFGNVFNRGVSDILDTYILRVGLENGRYSFSTAVNLFKSVINLALLLGANKLSEALTEKSLF